VINFGALQVHSVYTLENCFEEEKKKSCHVLANQSILMTPSLEANTYFSVCKLKNLKSVYVALEEFST